MLSILGFWTLSSIQYSEQNAMFRKQDPFPTTAENDGETLGPVHYKELLNIIQLWLVKNIMFYSEYNVMERARKPVILHMS